MLNGHFENCYGLKRFNLPNINFSRCNKALIYAPNGVMKSSLSKVFDDISKGSATSDRIFQNVISSYSVTHYTSQYVFSSANATQLPATDKVYVVNTFNNSFEFTKETVNDTKKKLLISSIPFYRNLCEYSGKDIEYSKLTCFLQLKTTPLDTLAVKISDLWNLINPFLNNTFFSGGLIVKSSWTLE